VEHTPVLVHKFLVFSFWRTYQAVAACQSTLLRKKFRKVWAPLFSLCDECNGLSNMSDFDFFLLYNKLEDLFRATSKKSLNHFFSGKIE